MALVILGVLLLSLTVSCHHVYYVLPDNHSNASCPPAATVFDSCNTLSQYAAQSWKYFQSNTTFYFMTGQHYLNREIRVIAANNLMFKGLGKWREGPTENTMESTAVISCTEKIGGLRILLSKKIVITGITVTNCTTSNDGPALDFAEIQDLKVVNTSVKKNGGLGMRAFNVNNLVIDSCSFFKNGHQANRSTGNLAILTYLIEFEGVITNTNFTSGNGPVDISLENSFNVRLNIKDVVLADNMKGGSMWLGIYNSSIARIKLNKVTVVNGHASEVGVVGGLTLSLGNLNCSIDSQIMITKTLFQDNFSEGMTIFLHSVHQCTVTIANSLFLSNGVNLQNNHLSHNLLYTRGGGLNIVGTQSAQGNTIAIVNVLFQNNSAVFGGALVYSHACRNQVKIINTTFEDNYGYYGPAIAFRPNSTTMECRMILNNVTVSNSRRLSDLIMRAVFGKSFSYSDNIFFMNSAFTIYTNDKMVVEMTNVIVKDNHNMSGMSLHGCDVTFNGNNVFVNNTSPLTGGGLTFSTSNSFIVNEGSHILFANNTAGLFGGAIYVKDMDHDDLYVSVTIYGEFKQCSFMTNEAHPNPTKPLLTFQNNHALRAGDDVYGGTYQFCKLSPNGHNKLIHIPLECPTAQYWSLSSERSISSSPIAVCPCFDDEIDCTVRNLSKEIYPGQLLSVSLVTVGTCQGVSPGDLVASMKEGNILTTAKNQVTSSKCKEFNYLVNPFASNTNSSKVIVNAARTKISIGMGISINIKYLQCPHGFEVSNVSSQYHCDCNSIIRNSYIHAQCNLDNLKYGAINRSGNNWIGYLHQYSCVIAHTDCPFDYCKSDQVSFNITSPDPQCSFNRTGILCGQCQPGLSLMLGSSKCKECHNNAYLLLILLFLVAGIVLLVALILFNFTVSSGEINGLLFYANLVKLNESIFFPNGSVPVLSQFISWLNLDFGIETCFVDGLDGYWKTWLQFVFPIYLWILAMLVIIGCQYSLTLSRLCGRNAVPVLATLFLMSYTKLLRNITNVFMYTSLSCGTNDWILWRIDTTIAYFSYRHVPLLAFSVLLLVLGVIYTLLVFSSQWLQRYSSKCFCRSTHNPVVKLKPLIDAYCGPYNDDCRYWTGLLLIARIILTSLFSYTSNMPPQVNKTILLTVTMLLTFMAWLIKGVYKERKLTLLEAFHYLSIGFITLGSTFAKQETISVISVSIILLLAVLVRVYKILQLLKQKCRLRNYEIPLLANDKLSSVCKYDAIPGSPAVVLRRRESLIFDFTLND